MNDHSKRLIEAVLNAICRYEVGIVSQEDILRDIEGIGSALEEQDIQMVVSNFAVKIDESRYLYGLEDGKQFLSAEIQKLKAILDIKS